jgi:hypothetical protein
MTVTSSLKKHSSPPNMAAEDRGLGDSPSEANLRGIKCDLTKAAGDLPYMKFIVLEL